MPLRPPAAGGVDLWLIPVPHAPDAARDEALAATLTDAERGRLGRFRVDTARLQFLLARSTLRRLLSRYRPDTAPAAWRFVTGSHGKPRLPDVANTLDFNVSHTDGMAAIAFTGGAPVGVDVERERRPPDTESLFARCLSGRESRRLRAVADGAERGARFLDIWTLKEAYLKACGVGLSRDLRDVELVFDGADRLVAVRDRAGGAGRWLFARVPSGENDVALALAMPRDDVSSAVPGIVVREYALDGSFRRRCAPAAVFDVALHRDGPCR